MNGFTESIQRIIERFEAAGLEYMIVGSVAATIYGEPRLTRDIDIVLSLKITSIKTFYSALPTELYYVPPAEIVAQEITRQGQFNVLDLETSFKIDLVFCKSSPHSLSEFGRKRRIKVFPNLEAWFAAPEDIILKKLQYYLEGRSEKHLIDIRGIIANSDIDQPYLKTWISALRLEEGWRAVN